MSLHCHCPRAGSPRAHCVRRSACGALQGCALTRSVSTGKLSGKQVKPRQPLGVWMCRRRSEVSPHPLSGTSCANEKLADGAPLRLELLGRSTAKGAACRVPSNQCACIQPECVTPLNAAAYVVQAPSHVTPAVLRRSPSRGHGTSARCAGLAAGSRAPQTQRPAWQTAHPLQTQYHQNEPRTAQSQTGAPHSAAAHAVLLERRTSRRRRWLPGSMYGPGCREYAPQSCAAGAGCASARATGFTPAPPRTPCNGRRRPRSMCGVCCCARCLKRAPTQGRQTQQGSARKAAPLPGLLALCAGLVARRCALPAHRGGRQTRRRGLRVQQRRRRRQRRRRPFLNRLSCCRRGGRRAGLSWSWRRTETSTGSRDSVGARSTAPAPRDGARHSLWGWQTTVRVPQMRSQACHGSQGSGLGPTQLEAPRGRGGGDVRHYLPTFCAMLPLMHNGTLFVAHRAGYTLGRRISGNATRIHVQVNQSAAARNGVYR